MKINKNFTFIFICLFFICCSPLVFKPTADDVVFANQKWETASLEELQTGYKLFVGKCGGCHYLHSPGEFNEDQWMKILPEMCIKAKVSEEQKNLIVKYVLTKSFTQNKLNSNK